MKTLPFLLLACLLNTALSYPSGGCFGGCLPFRRQAARPAHHPDPNTVIPDSFPATAVSQPAELEPFLPFDMLCKIASVDLETKCALRTANKALRAELKFPLLRREDSEKIQNSGREGQLFLHAILKKDIDTVKRLYLETREYKFGLELAVRYNSPKAAWILLACDQALGLIRNDEEREKLRADAESQQTETGLADLAAITQAWFVEGGWFYVSLRLVRAGGGRRCEMYHAVGSGPGELTGTHRWVELL